MNQRTGELALDVAFEKFSGEPPVAMVCTYNGPAIPTREQVAEWNRPNLMGFESSTTRSYAGGDAGDADAAYSCWKFEEWGYPRECGSWFCVADTPDTPAQFLPNISEYARRYALRMIAGGRSGPLTVYGNRDAVEAAAAGIRAAGLVACRWGVGTWTGYGEGGGPNQPPALADCELLQSGNTPGPRPATDLDWLYAPVVAFAPMGGPKPAPAPPTSGGDMDMYVGQLDKPNVGPIPVTAHTQVALLVSPRGRIISTWSGDPNEYGVPKTAAAWANARPKVNVILLDPAQMAEIVVDHLAVTAPGGGGGTATIDTAGANKILDALAARLVS